MRTLITLACLLSWQGASASAQTEESVAEKSARLGEAIADLQRRIGDGDDAPGAEAAPASGLDASLALMIEIAAGRPATDAEVRAFAGAHPDLPEAIAERWRAFPEAWATTSDPAWRLATTESVGAHVYCDFAALDGPAAAQAMMAGDPVLAARCEDDESLAIRESSWAAALAGVAFAAEATGRPGLTRTEVATLRPQMPEHFETGKIESIRNWARSGAEWHRLQAQWAALGNSRSGQLLRKEAVQKAAAEDDPVMRAAVLRDAIDSVHRTETGLDDTFANARAANNLIARESWILMHVPGDPAGQ